MAYICFIELTALTVPHMQALEADTLVEAEDEVRRLMDSHASAVQAEIYEGQTLVATVQHTKEQRGRTKADHSGSLEA